MSSKTVSMPSNGVLGPPSLLVSPIEGEEQLLLERGRFGTEPGESASENRKSDRVMMKKVHDLCLPWKDARLLGAFGGASIS